MFFWVVFFVLVVDLFGCGLCGEGFFFFFLLVGLVVYCVLLFVFLFLVFFFVSCLLVFVFCLIFGLFGVGGFCFWCFGGVVVVGVGGMGFVFVLH